MVPPKQNINKTDNFLLGEPQCVAHITCSHFLCNLLFSFFRSSFCLPLHKKHKHRIPPKTHKHTRIQSLFSSKQIICFSFRSFCFVFVFQIVFNLANARSRRSDKHFLRIHSNLLIFISMVNSELTDNAAVNYGNKILGVEYTK